MSISREVQKLRENLKDSYDALEEKGASLPAKKNFDNLSQCIESMDSSNNTTLVVQPTTEAQVILPPEGYTGYDTVTVNGVTAEIDIDITPDNIRKGIDILGVLGTVTELVGDTLTVTQNGTYAPSGVYNGFTSVEVTTPIPVLITKTITSNTTSVASTEGADGYSTVTVDVPSPVLITKTITSNNTYAASSDNADGYSSVTVNVPDPSATYIGYLESIKTVLINNGITVTGDYSNLATIINNSYSNTLSQLQGISGNS